MVAFIRKAHGCIFLYDAIEVQEAQLAISDSPPPPPPLSCRRRRPPLSLLFLSPSAFAIAVTNFS